MKSVHTPAACLGQWRPFSSAECLLFFNHLYGLHGGGSLLPKIFLSRLVHTGESPHLLAA